MMQLYLERHEANLIQQRRALLQEEEEWGTKVIDAWLNIVRVQALLILENVPGTRPGQTNSSIPESIRDKYHRLGLLDSVPLHSERVQCREEVERVVSELRTVLIERRNVIRAKYGGDTVDITRLIKEEREEFALWSMVFSDEHTKSDHTEDATLAGHSRQGQGRSG